MWSSLWLKTTNFSDLKGFVFNVYVNVPINTPLTVRKELSKLPREAVCSAVSSRVRGNFGEKFASQGPEDKIKHV